MDFSMTEDESITDGSIRGVDGSIRGASQNYLYDDLESMASAILRRNIIEVADWAMGTCDEMSLKPVHELITGGPCLDSPVYEELVQHPSPSPTMVEVSFDGIKNTISYCSDDDESVTEVLEEAEEHEAKSRRMVYLRSEYSQKSILDATPSGKFPRTFQLLQNLRSTGSLRLIY